jgi:hypothetical protein
MNNAQRTTRSALDMINDCFRHQHPEAYGRESVPGAIVPAELRYGRDPMYASPAYEVPEERMGDPDAVPLGEVAPRGRS